MVTNGSVVAAQVGTSQLPSYGWDSIYRREMVALQAAPSWDLVITLVFVIGISYGFIILRDRILVTLLSLYTGSVVANILAGPIEKFFKGDTALLNKVWVESSVSPFAIKAFLFIAVIILVGAKSGLGGRRSQLGLLELAAYSGLTVCIGLATLFSFMDPTKVAAYTASSKLAALIVHHQALWYIAPLVILALMGGASYSRGPSQYDY